MFEEMVEEDATFDEKEALEEAPDSMGRLTEVVELSRSPAARIGGATTAVARQKHMQDKIQTEAIKLHQPKEEKTDK